MTYAFLAQNRDDKQLAELELALDPSPEKTEAARERANMEAMRQLQQMTPPPVKR